MTETERLIDREEFAKRASFSVDRIKRLEKISPGFPQPVKIPGVPRPRRQKYLEAEVNAWIRSLTGKQ